jgi:hypothetical protein
MGILILHFTARARAAVVVAVRGGSRSGRRIHSAAGPSGHALENRDVRGRGRSTRPVESVESVELVESNESVEPVEPVESRG